MVCIGSLCCVWLGHTVWTYSPLVWAMAELWRFAFSFRRVAVVPVRVNGVETVDRHRSRLVLILDASATWSPTFFRGYRQVVVRAQPPVAAIYPKTIASLNCCRRGEYCVSSVPTMLRSRLSNCSLVAAPRVLTACQCCFVSHSSAAPAWWCWHWLRCCRLWHVSEDRLAPEPRPQRCSLRSLALTALDWIDFGTTSRTDMCRNCESMHRTWLSGTVAFAAICTDRISAFSSRSRSLTFCTWWSNSASTASSARCRYSSRTSFESYRSCICALCTNCMGRSFGAVWCKYSCRFSCKTPSALLPGKWWTLRAIYVQSIFCTCRTSRAICCSRIWMPKSMDSSRSNDSCDLCRLPLSTVSGSCTRHKSLSTIAFYLCRCLRTFACIVASKIPWIGRRLVPTALRSSLCHADSTSTPSIPFCKCPSSSTDKTDATRSRIARNTCRDFASARRPGTVHTTNRFAFDRFADRIRCRIPSSPTANSARPIAILSCNLCSDAGNSARDQWPPRRLGLRCAPQFSLCAAQPLSPAAHSLPTSMALFSRESIDVSCGSDLAVLLAANSSTCPRISKTPHHPAERCICISFRRCIAGTSAARPHLRQSHRRWKIASCSIDTFPGAFRAISRDIHRRKDTRSRTSMPIWSDICMSFVRRNGYTFVRNR